MPDWVRPEKPGISIPGDGCPLASNTKQKRGFDSGEPKPLCLSVSVTLGFPAGGVVAKVRPRIVVAAEDAVTLPGDPPRLVADGDGDRVRLDVIGGPRRLVVL